MNFRSLLVFLDGDVRCDARVHLAARFAVAHGSHVNGIAPTERVQISASVGAATRQLNEAAAAQAEALRVAEGRVDRFRARCCAEGVASAEGCVHEGGDAVAAVLHHAHCADLTVIGQADPASRAQREQNRFVEQVLLHNARPTLVVPHTGRFDAVGDRVLVAWDDSPGCARTVADALPLLRHAGQVHVRVWQRRGEASAGRIGERMHQVQQWLLRDGVAADVEAVITDLAIGDALLHDATELGSDLIVMGTYGHSRWTERVVGGATRTALARSPLPLLMSH